MWVVNEDLNSSKEGELTQGHTKDLGWVGVLVVEHGVGVQGDHGVLLLGAENYVGDCKTAD